MTGEILKQYKEACINERLDLFLQFPDLRRSFQKIDCKDLAFQKASISLREEHDKVNTLSTFYSSEGFITESSRSEY